MTRPVIIVSHLDYLKSVWIQSALLNSTTCFTDKYRDRENMQQQILVERYNMERKTLRDYLDRIKNLHIYYGLKQVR